MLNTRHTVSTMWGKPFEALCMPGRWVEVVVVVGFTLGPDVCNLCCGSCFSSVFLQHGCHWRGSYSVVQVSFMNGQSLQIWLDPTCFTPTLIMVQWIIRQERCGDFDAACVSSEPVWCALVYAVFCFEKECGCSCKNTKLYVSSGSPPHRSWVPLWAGISAPCLTGQSSQRGINVSIANLALQLLNAGGASKNVGLNLQCFLFLGWLSKQWGYKMLSPEYFGLCVAMMKPHFSFRNLYKRHKRIDGQMQMLPYMVPGVIGWFDVHKDYMSYMILLYFNMYNKYISPSYIILSLILIVIMCFFLLSCNNNNKCVYNRRATFKPMFSSRNTD